MLSEVALPMIVMFVPATKVSVSELESATMLVPLASIVEKLLPVPVMPVSCDPLPNMYEPEILPLLVMLPVTSSDTNVPTLVIAGCAAVYTVPATSALAT